MANDADTKMALAAAESALGDAINRHELMKTQHQQAISEIVHDIKNPLSAMMGYIALLKNEVAGPVNNDTYSTYFSTLDTAAERLLGLCGTLLGEYADGPQSADAPRKVDAKALVDEVHELFAAQAEERGIELAIAVDKAFPDLKADPQDMYRALTNLVSNAIKFTPSGGKIKVQAEIDPDDDTFIMVVRDSGVGMTLDQINQIKESRLTTVSPHGDVGTGQGLGVVNRIVQQLGGKLEIISSENRGTRMKMRFPSELSLQ